MGLAAALYWRANGRRVDGALVAFLVGVAGLQAWWLRFGRACGQQRQAFLWLVALAVVHALIAAAFARASALSGALLVPLVAWLSFASFLVHTTRPLS
jgi:tryptophan-rich sensory protein